ncbi:MAG: hypothetical protein BWX70_01767 [Verrucomicrobia bacterium ADurb.Bin070]|nr:MAG: hypothetical protein BWX70_01767 [Verrucomicrobia bacterium ADurb.Bin070]
MVCVPGNVKATVPGPVLTNAPPSVRTWPETVSVAAGSVMSMTAARFVAPCTPARSVRPRAKAADGPV